VVQLGSPIAYGSRSVVYSWGNDAVAKVPLPSTPEGWIRYEAHFTHAVYLSGAPVPKVLSVEVIDGREVSIFERIHGPSLWDKLVRTPRQARSLGRTLAALHETVLNIVPPISLPSQHCRLVSKIEAAAARFDSTLRIIVGQLGSTSANHLCHGDFHPKNILLSGDGPMVVDWFDVSRGDRISDVARTSLLLTTATHLDGSTESALEQLHSSYLDAMCASTSFTDAELSMWYQIHAAARLSEGVDEVALMKILQDQHVTVPAGEPAVASRP
jgi:aminoglycoside phosphotransferase (APT) family kinase protein